MSYTASLDIKCWKRHCCVACGCSFRYLLSRKVTAQGGTKQKALENVHGQFLKAIRQEVDYCPCPECGVVQPDMVAARRNRSLWPVWIGVVAMLIALIVAGAYGIAVWQSALLAAGGALSCFLLAGWSAWWNPNARPEGNRALALPRLKSGDMVVEETSGSATEVRYDDTRSNMTTWLAVSSMGVAVVAALSPLILALALGWPSNTGWYPEVVGRGDQARYYLSQRVTSLQGFWRGTASAVVLGQQPPGGQLPPLAAETKNSSWGDRIKGKSLSNNANRLWALVRIPSQESFSKRRLELEFQLSVIYPVKDGNGFEEMAGAFQERGSVQLAGGDRPGLLYSRCWLWGHLGGAALILIGLAAMFGQNGGLRGKALPAEVLPLGFDVESAAAAGGEHERDGA